MNEVSVKVTKSELKNIDKLSIKELESFGTNIQSEIDNNCTTLLNSVRVSDLGDTGDKLDELQSIANKQKQIMLPGPLKKFSLTKITNKYIKAQDKIDNITTSIEKQRDHLTVVIDGMIEQATNLSNATSELKNCEAQLNAYVDYLQEKQDPDQIRLQVAANRLKLITSSRVNAEQANLQALMIIKSNQESQYQLNEVIQNVVPILKMQAINSIGIQANKDAVSIANKTKKITGELIVKNANDIKDLANELEKNRNSSPIDEQKLQEAQDILTSAIQTVNKASLLEAENNIKVSKKLAESAAMNQTYIKALASNNEKLLEK